MTNKKIFIIGLLLFSCVIFGVTGTSSAAVVDVYLDAQVFTKTMPDGIIVTMWGYAQCTDGTFAACNPATVPGPVISAFTGDTLNIHLRNSLTGFTEVGGGLPTSIVINGQTPSVMGTPTWTDGTTGSRGGDLTKRVRSFTTETAAAATTTYTWNNLRPGTYLYESGTHQAVQVQMGLYGALKVDEPGNEAYPSISYDSDVILLYSEVDPAIHDAVAADNYGPGKTMTSTIDYEPKYFLINGEPFAQSLPPVYAGGTGDTILLRFLNAGLRTTVPIVKGLNMQLIAEDGNLFPYSKIQHSILLPAGKTTDALITAPAQPQFIPVFDRRLHLTNEKYSQGGMLTYLGIGSSSTNTLAVTKTGTGTGTVTSVPGGINCGSDCTENYNIEGPTVTLLATPDYGSFVSGWTGCDSNPTPTECEVTLNAPKTVNATFNAYTAVTVLTPNGGEILATGSKYNIQWGAPASAVRFRLLYSINNGATWQLIANNVSGMNYYWTVPRLVRNSRQCLIRIVGLRDDGTVVGSDRSDAPFSIEVVRLTSPNGGEVLTSGDPLTITWITNSTRRPVASVVLSYTFNNGTTWRRIDVVPDNPGTYDWTVPVVTDPKSVKVRVILRDSANRNIGMDVSDDSFSISPVR